MNPGKMKNRIAFYRFVTSSDSYGGFLSSGTNEVEVIIRKKTFDIVDNNEMTFKIDGSGSYRINDVFESDIDKYITLKGTLVT